MPRSRAQNGEARPQLLHRNDGRQFQRSGDRARQARTQLDVEADRKRANAAGWEIDHGGKAADQVLHPVRQIPAGHRRNRGGRACPRGREGHADGPRMVVVPQAGQVPCAVRRGQRPGPYADRRLRPRATGAQRLEDAVRGGPPHSDPPRLLRPDRPAPDSRRSEGFRGRPFAECLGKSHRPSARLSALRRAMGTPLARRRRLLGFSRRRRR